MSEDTRITFCTTGVLLEKLILMKSLSQFTHIVLDEVHERDKDMDFLFIIIRMLMAKENSNVKIILMSATINSGEVSKWSIFLVFYQLITHNHSNEKFPVFRILQILSIRSMAASSNCENRQKKPVRRQRILPRPIWSKYGMRDTSNLVCKLYILCIFLLFKIDRYLSLWTWKNPTFPKKCTNSLCCWFPLSKMITDLFWSFYRAFSKLAAYAHIW